MITSFFKPSASKKKKADEVEDNQSPDSSESEPKKRKVAASASSSAADHTVSSVGGADEKDVDEKSTVGAQVVSFQNVEAAFPADWATHLGEEFRKPYFAKINSHLVTEHKAGKQIFPPMNLIFNAFTLTSWKDVRVVIIGQDPYHDDGQAHGLCFSVPKGTAVPPSLKNIYKEIKNDFPEFRIPSHGYLENWARQGVLLLNTALTVRAHEANSHKDIGWQTFTGAVIDKLNQDKKNVVFILWGAQAQKKGAGINTKNHLVLKSPHPSGLSANKSTAEFPHGFFQNHHFARCNTYLKEHGLAEIDW